MRLVRWHLSVILAFGRQRWENGGKVEASLQIMSFWTSAYLLAASSALPKILPIIQRSSHELIWGIFLVPDVVGHA